MNCKFLIGFMLVLSGATLASFAADPTNFSEEQVDAIWPELWESGSPDAKIPAVDSLSEAQVISEMTGNWSGWMGPDKLLIFLGTNRQVSVSGIKDGKGWEKHGEWKVISNKLVLFLPEDEFPVFIFRTEGKTWIFNPSAKALMSQMQRPTRPVPPSANDVRQPRSVLAVNGKISKEQVLNILRTMDDGLANKDASAIVTNFANNAVITATIVEGQRMDTSKDDPDSYRLGLEAGFKHFDNIKLQRKDILVQIAPNGRKATSMSTVIESFDDTGNPEQDTTRESATFEIIDGKIVITQMDSNGVVK